MNEFIFKSKKLKDTEKLAISIASFIELGDLVLLNGELGSGKTTFARAIINSKYFANDQNHIVPSPTFNFLQVYKFDNSVIGHADLYRVENIKDLNEIGFFDIVNTNDWLFVEWPKKIIDLIDKPFSIVNIDIEDDNMRKIELKTNEF